MLGILLLAVSVILYFSPRKRYLSYFLYISFMFDGYKVLIDPVLGGVKNGDIALVYTFVISLVMILQKKYVLVFEQKKEKAEPNDELRFLFLKNHKQIFL